MLSEDDMVLMPWLKLVCGMLWGSIFSKEYAKSMRLHHK
jgi:hypothetical protein